MTALANINFEPW